MSRYKMSLAAMLVAFAALLAHETPWQVPKKARARKNAVAANPASLKEGQALFEKECAICHGAKGDGQGPGAKVLQVLPANFTDATMMKEMTDAELVYTISEGRTPMPAFKTKLSEEQRWSLVNYLRTFSQKAPAKQPEHGQERKSSGAEHQQHTMSPDLKGMPMPGHQPMTVTGTVVHMNEAGMHLMGQASGTSRNPGSAPMEMIMKPASSWNLMFHGQGFFNAVQQTGPRGADKVFSTNWFMGMAEHEAGAGSVMLRAMVSLEPATVTKRRFPELFQTGETAFGKALVDGQHPHDLFMELSLQYARRLGERTTLGLYAAPVGDPALGPVAFPHRVSARELPQAPLGHHLQDSTHIANEVVTAGIQHGMFRLEASGFHGAEPNENRWNIDHGAIDSWSTRLAFEPTNNWSGQVSVGRLSHPEALETGDVVRSTASLAYNKSFARGSWASSLIWGRNHKTTEHQNINSYLVESVLQFESKNYLTGRIELVDRDELFDDRPEIKEQLARTVGSVFRVAAYTLGYTRDVSLFPRVRTDVGGNFTLYGMPGAMKPFYGRHPASVVLYVRFGVKT